MPNLKAQEVMPDGSAASTTKDGHQVRSTDPSAHPDATLAQKLKGDAQGALNRTVGSAQAAAGAVSRNEAMQQAGLEKMQEEDRRLGAKHGALPVGAGLREKATGEAAATTGAAGDHHLAASGAAPASGAATHSATGTGHHTAH